MPIPQTRLTTCLAAGLRAAERLALLRAALASAPADAAALRAIASALPPAAAAALDTAANAIMRAHDALAADALAQINDHALLSAESARAHAVFARNEAAARRQRRKRLASAAALASDASEADLPSPLRPADATDVVLSRTLPPQATLAAPPSGALFAPPPPAAEGPEG